MMRLCNCGCAGPAFGSYAYPTREERLRALEQYAIELERHRAEVTQEIDRQKSDKA